MAKRKARVVPETDLYTVHLSKVVTYQGDLDVDAESFEDAETQAQARLKAGDIGDIDWKKVDEDLSVGIDVSTYPREPQHIYR